MSEPGTVGSVFVANYPPFSSWRREALDAAQAALATPPAGSPTGLGLYLHVPFCRRRCHFCYFRVYTDKDARAIARYVDALIRETEILAGRPALAGRRPRFLYFGGGTPSYLAVETLRRLFGAVHAAWPTTGLEEVTFECEPGTLTHPKVDALRELGVSRLSLGIESFDDEVLRRNGRAHESAEVYRVRPWLAAAGFPSLNVDLIAGMLGESEASFLDGVRRTIDYGPDSVTIYQMELPHNTTFTHELEAGTLAEAPADWPTKRRWHDLGLTLLEDAGYERSSAYTMVRKGSGARFVYRDAVWHGEDLIGMGVASFSHLAGVHFQNLDGWDAYLEALEHGALPLGRAFATDAADRLTRELILQLKLGEVRPGDFTRKFGVDPRVAFAEALAGLAGEGMLETLSGSIRLTRQGLLQVDHFLPRFYAPRYRDARYT